ncbi:site-specific DNA-methyltransferase [Colwellia sp. UCD-KL20]|uniref:site-specific DNA-methyltransferase n=1 Tax=Colwellia sp. UCD-KL20 TaxID=1917165 RepID=UPI000970D1BD|nr:site-specific DNA-methyltransferase [Colwellia sp. UCD-KL20]
MPILNWLNKEQALTTSRKCSYRLLNQLPELSYGDQDTENMIIQGDNLEALKSLIPTHAGKVKCIFIDPPYNTKSAFEHYDDNLEHSHWLSMIYPRMEILHQLLANNGSIWITLDDNESHYMKVILDEIFGRSNFVANCIWQKLYTVKNSAKYLSDMHEHVLVYAKNKPIWERNLLPRTEKATANYSNADNDSRGVWTTNAIQARNYYSLGSYEIVSPAGKKHTPPQGTFWRISEVNFKKLDADNRIWWGKEGTNVPRVKKFLSEAKDGVVPATFWSYQEAGSNADAKKEVREIFSDLDEIFITPKPEKLIQRILQLASNENDLILDSFLGSGTTTAVAAKMNRKFIGVEMGEHAKDLCAYRQIKVTDGEQGGISKDVNWQGGGGFKFYQLGEVIFNESGALQEGISFQALAAHIWFSITRKSLPTAVSERLNSNNKSPLIGTFNGTAIYLLYNGILGDKRPQGGNVLTSKVLAILPEHPENSNGKKLIFGETSRMGSERLIKENIMFKQIPYDIKGR